MALRYADSEDVIPLLKGKVTGWRAAFLEKQLDMISTRLSAWYPTLPNQWEESEPDSLLRSHVNMMVSEAARKVVSNPEAMSSETAGPYAYSRYDSEDPVKMLFLPRDIEALEALLDAEKGKQATVVRTGLPMGRAKPMTYPGRTAFGNPWRRP